MRIKETGVLAHATAGTDRAVLAFPSLLALTNGPLLASCRCGSSKDSADETIELYRSLDNGRTWSAPRRCFETTLDGQSGSIRIGWLSELTPGHILIAGMWIDRQTYPGQPLFNPDTEGCLPMAILLAESYDEGQTWTPWRKVEMAEEIGPPSLTNPILKLAGPEGAPRLAMSIETNKPYLDRSKWYQRVVFFHSDDLGQTWYGPTLAGQDPTGRIFNWDQRLGVAPDGRIAAFLWTYDSQALRYLNVHRRISADNGETWSQAEDLGFANQAGHPAVLADGRVVLPWVDRFGSRSIRARLAARVDAPFDAASEVVLYERDNQAGQTTAAKRKAPNAGDDTTGDMLADMSTWSFGLPYAEVLPDGDVLVAYYAGTERVMDIHWARLGVNEAADRD